MINVTSIAAEKISELLSDEGKPSAGLRVFVQGGGCSGFQYGLMIEEGEPTADVDRIVESNGVRLFVDPISVRYLKGAEVDFVDNLSEASPSRTRTRSRPADAGRPSRSSFALLPRSGSARRVSRFGAPGYLAAVDPLA